MEKQWTGNVMTLAHFYDFYYLEAMSAGISMAISSNKDLAYKHSVVRLENDVKEALAELTKQMAFRIYVYLWAASLGEARYAKGMNLKQYFNILNGMSRSMAYSKALNTFPSDENVKNLKSVFAQNWGGAYGGKAWLSIVEAMEMYGKVSDATFIDHSIDLEHNGGNVFTKSANFGLDCSAYNASFIRRFLDAKFAHNILEHMPKLYGENIKVTLKTKTLFQRYINVMTVPGTASYIKMLYVINDMDAENVWLKDYSVNWGTDELGYTDKRTVTQQAEQSSGSGHTTVHPEAHQYLIVLNGRNEGVGICGNMRSYNNTVQTMTYHSEGVAYWNGYLWSERWLFEPGTVKIAREYRAHVRCFECGGVLSEDEQFSDSDGDVFCESCYNEKYVSCDKCGDEVWKENAVDAEHHHSYFWLCESCAEEVMSKCDDCGEWFEEYVVTEDNGEVYCESCAREYYCRECDKHYSDLGYHEYVKHDDEEQEGMEETTIEIEGGSYTTEAYHVGPLQIFNLGLFKHITKGMKYHTQWAIQVPALGMYGACGSDFGKAVAVANTIIDMLDWEHMTKERWSNVHENKKTAINKIFTEAK